VRGRKKALAEFARVFREATDDDPGLRIAIAHADAPEWIDDIMALVEAERPHADPDVLVAELGAAVGTHAGPGSVGFFWFADPLG
jgi:fatty acid-binding protein DegV